MRLSRRQFLLSSSLAAAATPLVRALPAWAQPAAVPATSFEELRAGVGIFTGRGGTIGWLASSEAVVVVDSQFPDTAKACVDGLQQRSARGIDALINTHHHGDHTSGNSVFQGVAKALVAQANVPGLQKAAAEADPKAGEQVVATTTFRTEWRQPFGQDAVVAKYYGPAHTGGDAIVVFERANVVHMGDLVFNRVHPFVDRAGGASMKGWVTVLEKVVGEHGADTMYIFGHGKEGRVTGTRADLMLQHDYFTAVLEMVRKDLAAGRSKEEVQKRDALPGFAEHVSPMPLLSLSNVLGVAYDELSAR